MSSLPAEKPLACWAGKDRYRGEVLSSLTLILRTGGCSHDRCRMCSYRHERYRGISEDSLAGLLERQLDWVAGHFRIDDHEMIKIYTSGSFFDPGEVPVPVLDAAASLFKGKLIIAETRPEYVLEERVSAFVEKIDTGRWDTPLYTAIGLETTNDAIREKSINKGFSCKEFKKAVREAGKGGAGVKAYLLMKPLFLTESEAVADMRSSITAISGKVEMISMNPCTVQRRTELEYYWKAGAYRPPYLWSILSILIDAPVYLSCDPLGGGYRRGPHNCGRCDKPIIDAISRYSLSGEREELAALFRQGCSCKDEWQFVIAHEMPFAMPLTR